MKYSKRERMQCPHGRFYWSRWVWDESKGQGIEDSVPDIGVNNCELCNEDTQM